MEITSADRSVTPLVPFPALEPDSLRHAFRPQRYRLAAPSLMLRIFVSAEDIRASSHRQKILLQETEGDRWSKLVNLTLAGEEERVSFTAFLVTSPYR